MKSTTDQLVTISPDDLRRIHAMRDEYLSTGVISGPVRSFVAQAWDRCRGWGLDPRRVRVQPLDAQRLAAAREQSRDLVDAAESVLTEVHATMASMPHVLALSDETGYILRALGDEASLGPAGRAANMFEGASWNERDIGCGGIGTCIELQQPVVLIGPEHFQEAYLGWTCIGLPLRNAAGRMVGALDFSVPNEHVNVHTWGWMLSVARTIEERLRSRTTGPATLPADRPLNTAHAVLEMIGRHCVGQSADALEKLRRQVGEAEDQVGAALARVLERHEGLENASRNKDQFIAALAHELRGPLFALQSCVQTLRHEGDDAEAVQWAARILDQQLAQVSRLVEELMDLERVERGKVELRPEVFSLREAVEQAAATVRSRAAAKHVTLTLDSPDVQVRADRARFVQVLTNLLTNAVRYNYDGGSVRVDGAAQDTWLELRVSDTGQGIEPTVLASIFEPFVQGRDRSSEGMGIGLALVRRLVELHGGSISARSQGPGRGSEFIVRLPVLQQQAGVPGARGGLMEESKQ